MLLIIRILAAIAIKNREVRRRQIEHGDRPGGSWNGPKPKEKEERPRLLGAVILSQFAALKTRSLALAYRL